MIIEADFNGTVADFTWAVHTMFFQMAEANYPIELVHDDATKAIVHLKGRRDGLDEFASITAKLLLQRDFV